MSETTPLGVTVVGAPTDVGAAAVIPGTREVLENIYNDFLDAKQKKEIALEVKFDTWIRDSLNMLKGHRQQEIRQQYEMGQIGRAEFEALEEFRVKLVKCLERCDPSFWDFDQYGIQYISVADHSLFKERVGKSQGATATHRDIRIKTGPENGVIKA